MVGNKFNAFWFLSRWSSATRPTCLYCTWVTTSIILFRISIIALGLIFDTISTYLTACLYSLSFNIKLIYGISNSTLFALEDIVACYTIIWTFCACRITQIKPWITWIVLRAKTILKNKRYIRARLTLISFRSWAFATWAMTAFAFISVSKIT